MSTHYEIQHGTGIISIGGKYSWGTKSEAIQAAKRWKADPKSYIKNMADENVLYWKKQTYTVVKKTVTIEEIVTV